MSAVRKEDYIGKVITWEQAVELFPDMWVAFEEPLLRGVGVKRGKLVAVLNDEEKSDYRVMNIGKRKVLRRTTGDSFGGYVHGELINKEA